MPTATGSSGAVGRITGEYRYDKNSEVRYCHFRSVEWLYAGQDIEVSEIYDRNFSQQAIYGFYRTRNEGRENYNVIDTKKLVSVVLEHSGEEVCRKPYILIIDEINRGNISKIFGELITLIEDDKREAFSVCLPYSRNRFSVPKNLYIIGTMNTSDRSIASVDIALRRRFVFVPVMPDVRLVADNVAIAQPFSANSTYLNIIRSNKKLGNSSFNVPFDNSERCLFAVPGCISNAPAP